MSAERDWYRAHRSGLRTGLSILVAMAQLLGLALAPLVLR